MSDRFHIHANTKDVTLGAVGATPNDNGASIDRQVLTLQPADATHPGVLTADAQTIGGAKTFADGISADSLPLATIAAPGAMSADDKARMDGVLVQVARVFMVDSPEAKAADNVHASYAGNTDDTKAELDLGTLAAGNLDTVVEATTAGADGNDITVQAVGSAEQLSNVLIAVVGTAVVISYKSGVATVGDVETAIGALAGADDIIAVKTPGTGATVLGAPGDDFAATALAGGANHEDFPGAFTNPDVPRNLRVTMAAGWDGGDVVVNGTDQFDAAQTEAFATGDNVVRVGDKIFKTVTSATKAAVGAAAAGASIGTGDKLGIEADLADVFGVLTANGTAEAVLVDPTEDAFTPTTAPDGATIYVLVTNV